MKKTGKWKWMSLTAMILLLMMWMSPAFAAETQTISIDPATATKTVGDDLSIAVNYEITNDAVSKGIQVRVHYDSRKLTFVDFTNVYPNNKLGQVDAPQDDTVADLDNDPNTDKQVNITWTEFSGSWPGDARLLFNANFKVKDAAYNGDTAINLSNANPAPGFSVTKTGMVVTVTGGKDAPSTPVLSPETGFYKDAVSVSATVDAAPITTYYTTDGTDPDENDTLYAGAFNVDGADGDVITVKMASYDASEPIWGNIGSAVYTFDKADPTGAITAPDADAYVTATALDITGTAADAAGSGVDKVEVSIDNGTTFETATGTATWSYSATLKKGANAIVVKITDKAGNVATVAGSTITYYPPLSLTVDGVDVTDGTVYVPNTAGNNTKTITVAGGSENYTTYTWLPAASAGVGALGNGTTDAEKIYTAVIDATGTHTITVEDPLDTSLFSADVTMAVVDFSVTADEKIVYIGETVTFTAMGQTGKVQWEFESGADVAGTPVLSGDDDEKAEYSPEKAGKFQPKVTDLNAEIVALSVPEVTVYTVPDFSTLPTKQTTILPGEDSDEFTISGGDGTYKWTVVNPDGSTDLDVTTASYTFTAPSKGSFAGTYKITAAGSGGFDHEFDIYVPLKVEPDVTAVTLLSNANPYPFTLTGAADTTPYTFTVDSHDDNQPDILTNGVFAGNMATYAFDPTDYSVTSDSGAKLYSLDFDIQGYTNPDMVDIRVAPAELFESLELDPADPTSGEKVFSAPADADIQKMFGTNPIKLVIGTPTDNKKKTVAIAEPQKFEAASGTVTSGVIWEIVGLEGSGTCVTIPVPCTGTEAEDVRAGTKAVYYQNDKAGGVWKKVDDKSVTIISNSLIEVEICEWSSNVVGIGSVSTSSATPGSSSSSDCFISSLDGNSNFAWLAMIAILAVAGVFTVARRYRIH